MAGLARPAAAGVTSLLLIGWGGGAPLTGWCADRMGQSRLPLAAAALAGALMTAVLVVFTGTDDGGGGGLPVGVLGLLSFGIGAATPVPVVFAAVRTFNPPSSVSTACALVNTVLIAAGAVFQPMVGKLLDAGWEGQFEEDAATAEAAGAMRVYPPHAWRKALAVFPASFAVAMVLALLLPRPDDAADDNGDGGDDDSSSSSVEEPEGEEQRHDALTRV